MRFNSKLTSIAAILALTVLATGIAISAQDRFSLKVQNGLDFAEFKGYDTWQPIAVSHNGGMLAVIVGNPAMIAAFKQGIPGNGKPFPDGAKMAKIHWNAKQGVTEPGQPLIPGDLHDIDFMVKDAKRFADSNGWGYGAFEYNAATSAFRPADQTDSPPQANDAKCGAACHTAARAQDYVFTAYPKR